MTRSRNWIAGIAGGVALGLAAMVPAFAQDIAPGGGTTLQEGVQTQPTLCPDGSKPASNASETPTDTEVTPAEASTIASDSAANPMAGCKDTTATTSNSGAPDETPSGTDAPAMR